MKRLVLLAVVVAMPSLVSAFAFSTAPGYGSAAHLDDNEFLAEWLGADGSFIDGLSFGGFQQGMTAQMFVSVTLNNFFDVGSFEWLSIWADWNQDLVFGDDELLLDLNDYWFDNGTTNFTVDLNVPFTATVGNTWMRARITADGDLSPVGDFFTGEVEDYQITVNPGDGGGEAIPEPTTLALLGTGLVVAALTRKKIAH